MKTSILTILASVALALTPAAYAGKAEAGPNKGRLLENTGAARAEFKVNDDHTVTVTFIGADKKTATPAAAQSITVIADGKDGKKAKVEFEKKGDVLVSKGKLPEGDGYNIAVQVKEKADAKPQNFRFKLDLSICEKCKLQEYACTCDD